MGGRLLDSDNFFWLYDKVFKGNLSLNNACCKVVREIYSSSLQFRLTPHCGPQGRISGHYFDLLFSARDQVVYFINQPSSKRAIYCKKCNCIFNLRSYVWQDSPRFASDFELVPDEEISCEKLLVAHHSWNCLKNSYLQEDVFRRTISIAELIGFSRSSTFKVFRDLSDPSKAFVGCTRCCKKIWIEVDEITDKICSLLLNFRWRWNSTICRGIPMRVVPANVAPKVRHVIRIRRAAHSPSTTPTTNRFDMPCPHLVILLELREKLHFPSDCSAFNALDFVRSEYFEYVWSLRDSIYVSMGVPKDGSAAQDVTLVSIHFTCKTCESEHAEDAQLKVLSEDFHGHAFLVSPQCQLGNLWERVINHDNSLANVLLEAARLKFLRMYYFIEMIEKSMKPAIARTYTSNVMPDKIWLECSSCLHSHEFYLDDDLAPIFEHLWRGKVS